MPWPTSSPANHDAWKSQFDQDVPGARATAKTRKILRNADNPGEVYILVEFASLEDAREGRRRVMESGVLDRSRISRCR